MSKYINVEKLKEEINKVRRDWFGDSTGLEVGESGAELGAAESILDSIDEIIDSLTQKQPEENKLPNKRMRVNYAICKLQSFKPLREAIVLDGYVYDEDKCYKENLLNYIHAIPESRLAEIRSYLKEKRQWPYDDDFDWEKQEQSEVDLEKEYTEFVESDPVYSKLVNGIVGKLIARHFAKWGAKHLKK